MAAPVLSLNFARSKRIDPRITFTRASSASYYGADGLLRLASANEGRIDHDPATGVCKGLLIEESRTNLLLNSTIDGANLATQSITTTAAARTISFYGAGTVTLSGTHSATVVGAGAYPTRTTYTYTPTAGTLTVTVSGTVQYAQDELGSFATSWVPTAGASATRAADVASLSGANFSSWYNASEGTFVATAIKAAAQPSGQFPQLINVDAGASTDRLALFTNSSRNLNGQVAISGVYNSVSSGFSWTAGVQFKAAFAYKSLNHGVSCSGSVAGTNTTAAMPSTATVLRLGNQYGGGGDFNGHISALAYYNTRLDNAALQALSVTTTDEVRPSLQLNFASSKRIDPRITFSRASTGTYMGNNGLIKTAQAGEARIEYNTSGTCLGLLIEESRTNLLTYSEQFDNAAWTKTRASISANAAPAPDGANTADKLVEDSTAGATHPVSSAAATLAANTSCTASVFVKPAGRNYVVLRVTPDGTNYIACGFNLTTGSAGTPVNAGNGSGAAATITAMTDGWYRISLSGIPSSSAANPALGVYPAIGTTLDSSGWIYNGDGASGLYIWGTQLEAGSFPTSYIPTTSASATRAAEAASITGANFSSWYNASEGTFITSADYASGFGAYARVYQVDDASANNELVVSNTSLGASRVFAYGVSGGSAQIDTSAAVNNATAGVQFKTGFAYKTNDSAFILTGGSSSNLSTDSACTMPVGVTSLRVGSGYGSAQLNGHIAQLTYFPRRLTNAQLQGLTA